MPNRWYTHNDPCTCHKNEKWALLDSQHRCGRGQNHNPSIVTPSQPCPKGRQPQKGLHLQLNHRTTRQTCKQRGEKRTTNRHDKAYKLQNIRLVVVVHVTKEETHTPPPRNVIISMTWHTKTCDTTIVMPRHGQVMLGVTVDASVAKCRSQSGEEHRCDI